MLDASRISDGNQLSRGENEAISEVGFSSTHTHAYAGGLGSANGDPNSIVNVATESSVLVDPPAGEGAAARTSADAGNWTSRRLASIAVTERGVEPPRISHDDDEQVCMREDAADDKKVNLEKESTTALCMERPLPLISDPVDPAMSLPLISHGGGSSDLSPEAITALHSLPQLTMHTEKYQSLSDSYNANARRRSSDNTFAYKTMATVTAVDVAHEELGTSASGAAASSSKSVASSASPSVPAVAETEALNMPTRSPDGTSPTVEDTTAARSWRGSEQTQRPTSGVRDAGGGEAPTSDCQRWPAASTPLHTNSCTHVPSSLRGSQLWRPPLPPADEEVLSMHQLTLRDEEGERECSAVAAAVERTSASGTDEATAMRLRPIWQDGSPTLSAETRSMRTEPSFGNYGGDRPSSGTSSAAAISRNLDSKAYLNTRIMIAGARERRRRLITSPRPQEVSSLNSGDTGSSAATEGLSPGTATSVARPVHTSTLFSNQRANAANSSRSPRERGTAALTSVAVDGSAAGGSGSARVATGNGTSTVPAHTGTAAVSNNASVTSALLLSTSRLKDSVVVIGGGVGSGLLTPYYSPLNSPASRTIPHFNPVLSVSSSSSAVPVSREEAAANKATVIQRARSLMAPITKMESASLGAATHDTVPVAQAGLDITSSTTTHLVTPHGSSATSQLSPPPAAERLLPWQAGSAAVAFTGASDSGGVSATAVPVRANTADLPVTSQASRLQSQRLPHRPTAQLAMPAVPSPQKDRLPRVDFDDYARRLDEVRNHGFSNIEEAIALSEEQERLDELLRRSPDNKALRSAAGRRPFAVYGLFGMLERASKFEEFGAIFTVKKAILLPFLTELQEKIHELSTHHAASRSFDYIFGLLRDEKARQKVGEEFYSDPVNSWPWHMLYLICCFRATAAVHGHRRLFSCLAKAGGLLMMGKGMFAALAVGMSKEESSLVANTAKMYIASFYVGILMKEKQEEHQESLQRVAQRNFGILLVNIPIASLRMLVEQVNLGRRSSSRLTGPDAAPQQQSATANYKGSDPNTPSNFSTPAVQNLSCSSSTPAGSYLHGQPPNSSVGISQNLISSPLFYSSNLSPSPASDNSNGAPSPTSPFGSNFLPPTFKTNRTQREQQQRLLLSPAVPHSEMEVSRVISTRSAVVCGHPLDLMRLDLLLTRFADRNGVKISKDYIPATAPENSSFYNREMAFDIVGYWDRMGVTFSMEDLAMTLFSPVDGEPLNKIDKHLFVRRIAEAASFKNQDLTYSLRHLRDGDVLLDFSVHSLAVGRLVDWGKKKVTVLSAPSGRPEHTALQEPRRSQQSGSMRETLERLSIVNNILRTLSELRSADTNNTGTSWPTGRNEGGASTDAKGDGGQHQRHSSNNTKATRANVSALQLSLTGNGNPLHCRATPPSPVNVSSSRGEAKTAFPHICIDMSTTFVELGLLRHHGVEDDEANAAGARKKYSSLANNKDIASDENGSDGEQLSEGLPFARPIASFSTSRQKMENSVTASHFLRTLASSYSRPSSPDPPGSHAAPAAQQAPPSFASGSIRKTAAAAAATATQEVSDGRGGLPSFDSGGSSPSANPSADAVSPSSAVSAAVDEAAPGPFTIGKGTGADHGDPRLQSLSSYPNSPSYLSFRSQNSARRTNEAAIAESGASNTNSRNNNGSAAMAIAAGTGALGGAISPSIRRLKSLDPSRQARLLTPAGNESGVERIPSAPVGGALVAAAGNANASLLSTSAAAPRKKNGTAYLPGIRNDGNLKEDRGGAAHGASPAAFAVVLPASGDALAFTGTGAALSLSESNNNNNNSNSHASSGCYSRSLPFAALQLGVGAGSQYAPATPLRAAAGQHTSPLRQPQPQQPQAVPNPYRLETHPQFLPDDYVVHANTHYKGVINVYQVAPLIKYYEMQFGVVLCEGAVLFSVLLSEKTGIGFPPYMLLLCPTVFALLELWDAYDFISRWCVE